MDSTKQQEHQDKLQIAIRRILKDIPDIIAIVLFGSYGSEYETSESDIDLAILSRSKMDTVTLWELAQQVAVELKQDVDLVDLQEASTVFRFQILSTGKVIFCSDPTAFGFFETTSFSMYLNFQETRKEILGDYSAIKQSQ
jgi:predicted nucleotidyltransferase